MKQREFLETALMLVTIATAIGGVLWKVLMAEIHHRIRDMRSDLTLKDKEFECLQERLDGQLLEHKNKMKVFSDRARVEISELNAGLDRVQSFLLKTTEYRK